MFQFGRSDTVVQFCGSQTGPQGTAGGHFCLFLIYNKKSKNLKQSVGSLKTNLRTTGETE